MELASSLMCEKERGFARLAVLVSRTALNVY